MNSFFCEKLLFGVGTLPQAPFLMENRFLVLERCRRRLFQIIFCISPVHSPFLASSHMLGPKRGSKESIGWAIILWATLGAFLNVSHQGPGCKIRRVDEKMKCSKTCQNDVKTCRNECEYYSEAEFDSEMPSKPCFIRFSVILGYFFEKTNKEKIKTRGLYSRYRGTGDGFEKMVRLSSMRFYLRQ